MPSQPERLGSYTRRYIGTEQHFAWLERIVYATLILNALDASFTIFWVFSGGATEANPMMATVLQAHPLMFMLTKLALVSMGSWLLWRHKKRPMAVVAMFLAFIVYYVLLLYHLSAFNLKVLDWITGRA